MDEFMYSDPIEIFSSKTFRYSQNPSPLQKYICVHRHLLFIQRYSDHSGLGAGVNTT